ncbi:class I adenylate-forming enzyme family protein [Falsiroseomonas sp. CW058]|uniref:class I adenylate-forming enzyme family protein n=1 Tax=Falsiroseomonas sp. CW058 TaxID=3388664 RepID=UPI003D31F0D5
MIAPHPAARLVFAGATLDGAALAGQARSLAARLRAAGVARGGRFGWIGTNHPAMLAAFFAAAEIGAAMVPFNWRLSEEELRWIARDAGIALLVRGPSHAAALPGIPGLPDRAEPGAPEGGPMDPLLIGYTSGTTGRPKGAVLTQSAFAANAAAARAVFGLAPGERVLTVLPMFHVGGLNIQTVPALLHGAGVLLHDRFDADAFLDAAERDRPTLSLVVPAVMAALVAHPRWATADLSSLRAVGAGSSEVPLHLIEAFHAKGVPVQQVYGATETSPIAIAQMREEALAAPGSIGRPVPGVEARLVPGTGEIAIRGPNVMAGYWGDAAATRAALDDGWFATGDVGRIDADGRWWFTDRLKHLIISGGENISPAEVERVLAGAPGVREGAVVGRPDPRWGEVPVAVVVPAEGFEAARVLAHFEGRLARFKQPRDVVAVEALPRTALGKVAVAELRKVVAR